MRRTSRYALLVGRLAHFGEVGLIRHVASGDIRNVLLTLSDVPDTYNSQLSATINDHDMSIVVRNVAMLLLLTVDDLSASTDCIIHIWYSSCLKPAHLDLIQENVQDVIDNVVENIKSKSNTTLHAKTITVGGSSIRVALTKRQWFTMQEILSRRFRAPDAEKSRRDIVLAREDYLDRSMFQIRRNLHRRVSKVQYRERGVLLPFGSSDVDHTVVNPYVCVCTSASLHFN